MLNKQNLIFFRKCVKINHKQLAQGVDRPLPNFIEKKERGDEMEKNEIEKKIVEIVEPFVEEMSLSLVDVEYLQEGGYWYVRIFIENLNGDLNIEDCSRLSAKVENEVESIIDKRFFLEVSSPGLERPLKKIEDYIRFKGTKITLHLKHKMNDKKQFKALIKDVRNEIIIFEIEKNEVEIEFKEIRKANILFEFNDF